MARFIERLTSIFVILIAVILITIQLNDEGSGLLINERLGLTIAALLLVGLAVIQGLIFLLTPEDPDT